MITRSGRSYKTMSDRKETMEHTTGDQEVSIPDTTASHKTPQPSREPVGVEEILHVIIEGRKCCEEEIPNEHLHQ